MIYLRAQWNLLAIPEQGRMDQGLEEDKSVCGQLGIGADGSSDLWHRAVC